MNTRSSAHAESVVKSANPVKYDAIIIGAGFAGLYLLHKLREMGFNAHVIEAGEDVGGTWQWNRYPGARCDVDSVEYQLAFPDFLQREWTWSERYATQPEIERYLQYVANRLQLRNYISFGERVVSASYTDDTRWTLTTDDGTVRVGDICITATGCLSVSQMPTIAGMLDFEGEVYHTGSWPKQHVDFAGRRVAVIGTGSSGVQLITEVAQQAAQLYVLQRTPTFVFPAYNGPLDPKFTDDYKNQFAELRERCRFTWGGTLASFSGTLAGEMSDAERQAELESRWQAGGGFVFLGAYADLLTNPVANEYAADFVRRKILEIVKDPDLAAQLTPHGFPLGTKRICLGTNYYETFLRDNVTLVDLRANPITKITETGILCGDMHVEVDMIAFATGFDAITGALSKIDVSAGNLSLRDAWRDGPETYLGLTVPGFPNFFMVTGPGSPSVLSNVVVSIEQHVDWIADCLSFMRSNGYVSIEPTRTAAAEWTQHVGEVADYTLYTKADSWYMGANVPGKKRQFLPYVGGVHTYRQKCDAVAKDGFAGFSFKTA